MALRNTAPALAPKEARTLIEDLKAINPGEKADWYERFWSLKPKLEWTLGSKPDSRSRFLELELVKRAGIGNAGWMRSYPETAVLDDCERIVSLLEGLGKWAGGTNGVSVPEDLPDRLDAAMKAYGHTRMAAAQAMGIKDRTTVTKLLIGQKNVLQETINDAESYIRAAPPD